MTQVSFPATAQETGSPPCLILRWLRWRTGFIGEGLGAVRPASYGAKPLGPGGSPKNTLSRLKSDGSTMPLQFKS